MTILIVITVIFTVLIIAWVALSIKVIGPDEIGAVSVFGHPSHVFNSGLHFIPFLFCRLDLYTKQILRFDFQVKTATTRNGKIKGYNNDKDINAADVNFDCVLFTYFPTTDALLKTRQYAPGNTVHDIGPAVAPYVIDVVRSVAGSLPWPLLVMEREKLIDYILARIVPQRDPYYEIEVDAQGFYSFKKVATPNNLAEMEAENPLVQFKLDLSRTSLNIEDVNLSDDELNKLLSGPEKARLRAMVKGTEAAAEKNRLKEEGDGRAYARQKMIEAIKDHPDLELLATMKEMAQGTSNTILYQIPAAFESRVKSMLGGNDPKDFLKNLTEEDWNAFQAMIKTLKK